MSYYFAIIGTQDNPIFESEFGTSKQGGDGLPRFSDQSRHLNQFILHSSLDVVEEVQWNNGQLWAHPSPLWLLSGLLLWFWTVWSQSAAHGSASRRPGCQRRCH